VGIYLEKFEKGEEVPVTTLEKIVEDYKINEGVLKLDCEGCEYEIILDTNDNILRHFDYIMMEYHYGFESLRQKLKNVGFRVNYTKPLRKSLKEKRSKYGDIQVGRLTAQKM